MARAIRILVSVTGVLIVLPVVLITLVVLVANMDWGRRLIERTTAQLSGGQVVLTGVSGRFPDDLRVAHVELRDAETLWLSADDVALQWSPSGLVRKQLQVHLLRAGRVELLRLPAPRPSREATSEPFELPMRIDVTQVEINELAYRRTARRQACVGEPSGQRARGFVAGGRGSIDREAAGRAGKLPVQRTHRSRVRENRPRSQRAAARFARRPREPAGSRRHCGTGECRRPAQFARDAPGRRRGAAARFRCRDPGSGRSRSSIST